MSGFFGPPARLSVVSFTRDLSTASGSQAVTGVGFLPRAIVFIGSNSASTIWPTVGVIAALSGSKGAISSFSNGYTETNPLLPVVNTGGGNYQQGGISSYDADGFTISWTKNGTPTGTATFYALCFA